MSAADPRVGEALAWLERRGRKRVRDDMVKRYGIVTPKAFGVPMRQIQELAKRLGGTTRSPRRCGRRAGTRRARSPRT